MSRRMLLKAYNELTGDDLYNFLDTKVKEQYIKNRLTDGFPDSKQEIILTQNGELLLTGSVSQGSMPTYKGDSFILAKINCNYEKLINEDGENWWNSEREKIIDDIEERIKKLIYRVDEENTERDDITLKNLQKLIGREFDDDDIIDSFYDIDKEERVEVNRVIGNILNYDGHGIYGLYNAYIDDEDSTVFSIWVDENEIILKVSM